MLSSAADFKTQLLDLTPTIDVMMGVTAFVGALADFSNQVQAGSTGTPGIFTFNNATMIPLLLDMPPVSDNSWIPNFVSAWQTAVTASVITPATVTDPAIWTFSSVDTLTLPTAAATILTIPAAAALLTTGLNDVPSASDQTLQFAKAIRDATLAFTFTCIGLAAGAPPVPVPVPIGAQ